MSKLLEHKENAPDLGWQQDCETCELSTRARLFELVGRCAAGVVHDFNNLLTVIGGQAELLRMDASLAPGAQDRLANIQLACARAHALSTNVLEFVKSSTHGKVEIDAAAIIAKDLSLVRAAAPPAIVIRSRIAEECPRIKAGEIEVHQLLMNLCLNAIAAMSGGMGILSISVYASTLAGPVGTERPSFMLRIEDTGRGMDAETKRRIFQPFYSASNESGRTGLGLVNVAEIVRQLAGKIDIASEVGVGTIVTVQIPAAHVEVKEQNPTKPRALRVLYVDDEVALVRAQKVALSALGYRVVPKVCPVEADQYFRENPEQVDVVVMDARMPRINGFELTRRIRTCSPEMPVIMVTGSPEAVATAAQSGDEFQACLLKPILPVELDRAIRAAVARTGR